MNQDPHGPKNPPELEELQGALRRAVEEIRGEPVPETALTRALDRVRRGPPRVERWPSSSKRLAVVAVPIAACVLICVLLGKYDEQHNSKPLPVDAIAIRTPHSSPAESGPNLESNPMPVPPSPDYEGRQVEPMQVPEKNRPTTMTIYNGPHQQSEQLEGQVNEAVQAPIVVPEGEAATGRNDSTNEFGRPVASKLPHVDRLFKNTGYGNDQAQFRSYQVKGLSQHWAELPTAEREKAVEELGRNLPPQQQEGVQEYFKQLSEHEDRKKDSEAPQIVHIDQHRPTFARVYVGDNNSLELVSLQVTVKIEGSRARTLVDHIFYNPHDRQLEGTFEYPMPAGASPSYFAMFLGAEPLKTLPPRFKSGDAGASLPQETVARLTPSEMVKQVSRADWGTLREARVVSREKALETYEDVIRGKVDPALLEYAGGNTFSGRVFPILGKGYNRVLIAYEELLPVDQDRVVYRYPLPDCRLADMQFSLQADSGECKDAVFQPEGAAKAEGAGQVLYTRAWKDQGPGGEVRFTYKPAQPEVQIISGRQAESGPLYLYARIRPDLPVEKTATGGGADRAIFLLDTSLSEHPDRFALNMKLLRKILEIDPDIKHFNILTFNTGTSWVEPGRWLDNNPAGRQIAFSRLDGLVLEGATDLSAALDQVAQPGFDVPADSPVNLFLLSDGQITWGEPDVSSLVARFETRCRFPTRFYCYRTGISAENLELFQALERRGGGTFNCFTEAEIPAAARAHCHPCFQLEQVNLVGGPETSDLLVAGRQAAVYPGGEVIVAARAKATGRAQIVLEGTYRGKKLVLEYPVEITGSGELAPRGWGEIAVSSLLALNDPKFDSLITAYCQQFGIGSRAASFLVLENDADYKRFNLEEERGKTVAGDLGRFLQETWKDLGREVSSRERFTRFLARLGPRIALFQEDQGKEVTKLVALLTDADYELPPVSAGPALVHTGDVPPTYLAGRDADRLNVETYLAEARRRADARDAAGAVRVLSSIIEEYPTRADALRLVGYRLLDLGQAGQAVRLFGQVQQERPFEPHSYRDLARSLEESGKFGLTAVQYEIILAGTWNARFHDSLQQVVLEEYAHMMRQALSQHAVSKGLADYFGDRLERLDSSRMQSDLRVTISWNTDDTDVDLWVIEPDGTKCFYQNNRTKYGGELSQDETQGFGPERYRIPKAQPGVYRIIVNYYRPNPNLLGGETHVNVMVARNAGTPQEVVERHTVILKQHGQEVEVCQVKF